MLSMLRTLALAQVFVVALVGVATADLYTPSLAVNGETVLCTVVNISDLPIDVTVLIRNYLGLKVAKQTFRALVSGATAGLAYTAPDTGDNVLCKFTGVTKATARASGSIHSASGGGAKVIVPAD